MSFFSIRTLDSNDYSRCKAMLLDIFGEAELPQFIKSWDTRNEATSFVVISNTHIIGYILLDIHNKIQYLCVDPVFRNARLGSTLLQRSLDLLHLFGVKEVSLIIAKDSRLTSWYAKFGFIVVKNVYDENGEFLGADMILNSTHSHTPSP